MSKDTELWDKIGKGLHELNETYSDEMVLIGGIACWLHADTKLNSKYIDLSHDCNFYLSLGYMMQIREDYSVTKNKKLGKSEIKINDVSYYIYVENENNLCIPFSDLISKGVVINGFKCASLPHLISLKMDAFLDRKSSAKGAKDRRDVARILILLSMERGNPVFSDVKYLSDDALSEIKKFVGSNDVFSEITQGNSHEAKILKKQAKLGYEKIQNALTTDNEIGR